MDVNLLDERLTRLEKELDFFKKEENAKIEKISKEIESVENKFKELKEVQLPEVTTCKIIERGTLKKNIFEKHKTKIKNVKKELLCELRNLKNEKEKHDYNFLNKKYILSRIYEISNEVKQTFTVLKVRGEYFYKSFITRLSKLKEKCVCHFTTYVNMQKEINSMVELISSNALTDVAILNKNGVFFEKEMTKTFEHFYQHMCQHLENTLKE